MASQLSAEEQASVEANEAKRADVDAEQAAAADAAEARIAALEDAFAAIPPDGEETMSAARNEAASGLA